MKIYEIENYGAGRYAIPINDVCFKCGFFTGKETDEKYRCHGGGCPDRILNREFIQKILEDKIEYKNVFVKLKSDTYEKAEELGAKQLAEMTDKNIIDELRGKL